MALIAEYNMDGLFDRSPSANDLTYENNSGNLTIVDSEMGKVYSRAALNSGTDWLSSKNNVDLSGDFTMSCWAFVSRCHTGTANGLVTNHNHSTNKGAGITVKHISDTDFRISCNTGNGTSRTYHSYYGTTNIKDRWVCLTLRYKKTAQELTLWVDGNKETTVSYDMVCEPNKIGLFSWSLGHNGSNAYRPQSMMAGVKIYDHALSDDEIRSLYQTRAKLMTTGDFRIQRLLETKHKPLMVNYTTWENGQTGSVAGFGQNGSTPENSRVLGLDPWGKQTVLWKGIGKTAGGANAGWVTDNHQVDKSKTYRFSVWINRKVLGNGSAYLGLYGYNAASSHDLRNLANDNVNGNPYFWYGTPTVIDEWVLVVGHVHPSTTPVGAATSPESGIYTVSDGRIANIVSDYRWGPNTTQARHRSYLFYSTLPETEQYWCYPRIDLCDGTEPTIAELLAGHDSKNIEKVRAKNGQGITFDVARHITNTGRLSEVGPADGLVAWYPLVDDIRDKSGGYHGSSSGAVKDAGAYRFSSLDTAIGLPNDVGYSDAVSVSAWFKSMGTPGNSHHIIFGGQEMEVTVHVSGYLRTGVVANGVRCVGNSGSGLTDGQWHHVVSVYDGAKISRYIDGVLVGEQAASGSLTFSFSNRYIGRFGSNTTYWANGLIRDARIYNRPLSAKEVAILHAITNPTGPKLLRGEDTVFLAGELIEGS